MVVNNPHDKFLKPGTWVKPKYGLDKFIQKYIEITGLDLSRHELRLAWIYDQILYTNYYISMIVENRNRENRWEECILRQDIYTNHINIPKILLKIRGNGSE